MKSFVDVENIYENIRKSIKNQDYYRFLRIFQKSHQNFIINTLDILGFWGPVQHSIASAPSHRHLGAKTPKALLFMVPLWHQVH